MNVTVETMADHAVKVSWDLINSDQVQGYPVKNYIVYYSQPGLIGEASVTASSSQNSVVIGEIIDSAENRFRVAVTIDFNGEPETSHANGSIVTINPGFDLRLAGDIVKEASSFGVSPGSLVGIIFGFAAFIAIIAVITVMCGVVTLHYQRYDWENREGVAY